MMENNYYTNDLIAWQEEVEAATRAFLYQFSVRFVLANLVDCRKHSMRHTATKSWNKNARSSVMRNCSIGNGAFVWLQCVRNIFSGCGLCKRPPIYGV